jgi:hypothetical protein
MRPVLAQELITTEDVGRVMGEYFCLETIGQLSPEEDNGLVEDEACFRAAFGGKRI